MIDNEIIYYVNSHYTQNLSAKGVAKQFTICRFKFSKLFNQTTGTTFDLYVQKLRLAAATTYLELGIPIKQACYDSGFQSESQFFRVFKKNMGITPKEYARKNKPAPSVDYLISKYAKELANGDVKWNLSFADWLKKNELYSPEMHKEFLAKIKFVQN
jgi:AraC-like DNA-binding protein